MGGDQIEQLVVDFGGCLRLDFRADRFAERVKSDQKALLVEGLGYEQGVADFHTSHEAGTHAPAKAGLFAEFAENAVFGEGNKGGAKNGHQAILSVSARAGAFLPYSSVSHKGAVGFPPRDRVLKRCSGQICTVQLHSARCQARRSMRWDFRRGENRTSPKA